MVKDSNKFNHKYSIMYDLNIYTDYIQANMHDMIQSRHRGIMNNILLPWSSQ